MANLTFDNKISTGNVLTILGGILAFVFMFSDMRERITQIDGRVTLNEQAIGHVSQRVSDGKAESQRQWEQMNTVLLSINNKLDDIQKELGRKADRESAKR